MLSGVPLASGMTRARNRTISVLGEIQGTTPGGAHAAPTVLFQTTLYLPPTRR